MTYALQACDMDVGALDKLRNMDAGSISRFQVPLDVALCCHTQDTLALDTGPVYLWADSSPQASLYRQHHHHQHHHDLL